MKVVQEDERFHWEKTSKGIHYEKNCYIIFTMFGLMVGMLADGNYINKL